MWPLMKNSVKTDVNRIKTFLGDGINRVGNRLIRCVKSQGYSQVSGVVNWTLMGERENTGERIHFGTVVG